MNESKPISDYDNAIQALDAIAKLEADWDGLGSIKPTEDCLMAAWSYMRKVRDNPHLSVPVRILPSPQGTICFEWFNGKIRSEAEFVDGRAIEWMVTTPGIQSRFWNETVP